MKAASGSCHWKEMTLFWALCFVNIISCPSVCWFNISIFLKNERLWYCSLGFLGWLPPPTSKLTEDPPPQGHWAQVPFWRAPLAPAPQIPTLWWITEVWVWHVVATQKVPEEQGPCQALSTPSFPRTPHITSWREEDTLWVPDYELRHRSTPNA